MADLLDEMFDAEASGIRNQENISQEQRDVLNTQFAKCELWDQKLYKRLARDLNLGYTKVYKWWYDKTKMASGAERRKR